MPFFGNFQHSIDAKGRVSVPAAFRERLLDDSRLILAPFIHLGVPCIDVYPYRQWERLLDKLDDDPGGLFTAEGLRFEVYLMRSHQCEVDSAGRILLPQVMRAKAELGKEVVFLGAVRRFRLMDREKWEKLESEHDADLARNPGMYGAFFRP